MAVIQQAPPQQQARMVFLQMETAHKSFLDMHYFLKSQGIKNNNFFLALYDIGLRGIDPRDPNLPGYMKIRILEECRKNYWYFLREVLRIPVAGGDPNGGDRYRLDRAGLAMNFLFTLNASFYCEIPRQFGKTSTACARYLWIYNFASTNSDIMFMHKDHSGSKDNLKKLKSFRDALPSYLRFDSAIGADGKKLKVPNTIEKIEHPYNHNKIVTKPSARTRDAANNLGRGATLPLQFYDEFAFMPYNESVYMAAIPAFSTASANAKRNHVPYGIVITSTPGDLLTECGSYAYEIRNNATPFRESFYDMTYDQIDDIRNSNKNSNLFLICYTYKQLGAGPEYLNKMIKEMQGNWPAIRREILLEWAESPTTCPFSQEDLDIIKGFTKEPIGYIPVMNGKYEFLKYEDYDTDYVPIIGCDVSGAEYQDSSTIVVIDSHTTRVCAVLNCNYMPADDLAQVLYELITNYMPNAVLNIELNGGFGRSVVQKLIKTTVKKNLYWEIKDKVIEEAFNGYRMEKVKRKVKVYGTTSTKAIRARLIEILMERVKYHKDKFVSPIIQQEMSSMEVKKSGKIEHSDKTHDDTVFGYLMALYVWYEGKNLVENFGIQKSTLRTDEDEELFEDAFEDTLEKREKISIDNNIIDSNEDILETLEWVEKSVGYKSSRQLHDEQYIERLNMRDVILAKNKSLNDSMIEKTGVNVSPNQQYIATGQTVLPDELFDLDNSFDLNFEDDYIDPNNKGSYSTNRSSLCGNLSDIYNLL